MTDGETDIILGAHAIGTISPLSARVGGWVARIADSLRCPACNRVLCAYDLRTIESGYALTCGACHSDALTIERE
jgi:hypothetical protein